METITHMREFASWGEYVDTACGTSDWESRGSYTSGATWAGSESLEAAVAISRTGWPEGVAMMQADMDIAAAQEDRTVRARSYDVDGEEFDVEQWIEGSHELFEIRERKRVTRRQVTLVVNGSAPSSVTPETLTSYGAAIASLVASIEEVGNQRVRILYEQGGRKNGKRYVQRVVLKEVHDTLDLMQLAFPLIHPSALRRVCFAVLECTMTWKQADEEGFAYGYGGSVKDPAEDLKGEPNTYILPEVTTVDGHGPGGYRTTLLEWWDKANA